MSFARLQLLLLAASAATTATTTATADIQVPMSPTGAEPLARPRAHGPRFEPFSLRLGSIASVLE